MEPPINPEILEIKQSIIKFAFSSFTQNIKHFIINISPFTLEENTIENYLTKDYYEKLPKYILPADIFKYRYEVIIPGPVVSEQLGPGISYIIYIRSYDGTNTSEPLIFEVATAGSKEQIIGNIQPKIHNQPLPQNNKLLITNFYPETPENLKDIPNYLPDPVIADIIHPVKYVDLTISDEEKSFFEKKTNFFIILSLLFLLCFVITGIVLYLKNKKN